MYFNIGFSLFLVKKSNKKNMKEMFGKICLVLDAYQEKLMTHNKMVSFFHFSPLHFSL